MWYRCHLVNSPTGFTSFRSPQRSSDLYELQTDFDIDTSILEKLNTHGLEADGFEINELKLELHGLCPSCGNATRD
jgi:Fe2+ or Zn2+ uptake regulation protein